eukprot:3207165-Rhodomonas_salina.1
MARLERQEDELGMRVRRRLDLRDQSNEAARLDEQLVWEFCCGDAAAIEDVKLAPRLQQVLPECSDKVILKALRRLGSEEKEEGEGRGKDAEGTEKNVGWEAVGGSTGEETRAGVVVRRAVFVVGGLAVVAAHRFEEEGGLTMHGAARLTSALSPFPATPSRPLSLTHTHARAFPFSPSLSRARALSFVPVFS